MRKILFLLILVVSLWECKKNDTPNTTTNSHWTELLNDFNTSNLFSVCFANANTGYIVGQIARAGQGLLDSAVILKTTNGGHTWKALRFALSADLFSVYFTDTITGYAVGTGYALPFAWNKQGLILRTKNGGATWFIAWTGLALPKATPNWLHAVYFTNASTGYAVGSGYENQAGVTSYGVILKTIDAGYTWTALTLHSDTADALYSLYFTNPDTGYAVGSADQESNGVVLKTINAGNTWTTLVKITGLLNSIYFADASTGYALGEEGAEKNHSVIIKTADGGASWKTLSLPVLPYAYSLNSVYFTDADKGYAVGSRNQETKGVVLMTINGGSSWTDIPIAINGSLHSISFINANTGYAVGSNGTILKTTTAGQ